MIQLDIYGSLNSGNVEPLAGRLPTKGNPVAVVLDAARLTAD